MNRFKHVWKIRINKKKDYLAIVFIIFVFSNFVFFLKLHFIYCKHDSCHMNANYEAIKSGACASGMCLAFSIYLSIQKYFAKKSCKENNFRLQCLQWKNLILTFSSSPLFAFLCVLEFYFANKRNISALVHQRKTKSWKKMQVQNSY